LDGEKNRLQQQIQPGEAKKSGFAGNGYRSFSAGVPERRISASSADPTDKYRFSWDEPFEKEAEGAEMSAVSMTGSKPMAPGKLGRLIIRLDPEESVTPLLQQWGEKGHSFPKNAIIVALTKLKRHRRYKQALEVC
jgi:hypothetical protein